MGVPDCLICALLYRLVIVVIRYLYFIVSSLNLFGCIHWSNYDFQLLFIISVDIDVIFLGITTVASRNELKDVFPQYHRFRASHSSSADVNSADSMYVDWFRISAWVKQTRILWGNTPLSVSIINHSIQLKKFTNIQAVFFNDHVPSGLQSIYLSNHRENILIFA